MDGNPDRNIKPVDNEVEKNMVQKAKSNQQAAAQDKRAVELRPQIKLGVNRKAEGGDEKKTGSNKQVEGSSSDSSGHAARS